jgi:ElaB/YqjD/DUF883 family membrane-anchored ribosome-binding protein
MNSENNPNVNASTTTSPGGPPKQDEPPEAKNVNEADYLTRQQTEARAAISGVLADMKRAFADGADVREWTRQHPWIMAGSAAAAGFVAGMLVVPKKEESFKEYFEEKWEAFKEKMTPPATATATVGEQPPPTVQPEKSSMLGVIMRETLKAIGPTIGGLITAALASQQAQASDGHAGNGSHAASGAEPVGRTPPV